MLELIRSHPFGCFLAVLLFVAFGLLSCAIGCAVITSVFKFVTWLVPKLDAAAWQVFNKIGL